jgi:hypothetical protein
MKLNNIKLGYVIKTPYTCKSQEMYTTVMHKYTEVGNILQQNLQFMITILLSVIIIIVQKSAN